MIGLLLVCSLALADPLLRVLDDVVLIIKTGKEVIDERLMPLLSASTQFAHFRNRLIVSNGAHQSLSVFDAIANMSIIKQARSRVLAAPERYAEYLARTPPQTAGKKTKRAFGRAAPGWHTDQHKNLPAFRRAFELFPSARWYFMIDDDTYVSARNLALFVNTRTNSTASVYAGNIMGCNCCDAGKTPRYRPVRFAHGGSGILLSHTALQRMTEVVDACIFRFSSCWAGDIQVSLCLLGLEPQIKIQSLQGTHSQTPTGTLTKTHGRWCENPVTFHRMLPAQSIRLSVAEEQSWQTNNHFQLGALIEPFFINTVLGNRPRSKLVDGEIVCLNGTTNGGMNLDQKQIFVDTVSACNEKCQQRRDCQGFVHHNNRTCTLKRNLAAQSSSANATFCMFYDRIKARFAC